MGKVCYTCSNSPPALRAGKHNRQALAQSNATLKRTDLVCELVGSLAFGWAYSQAGMLAAVGLTSAVAVAALPAQWVAIYRVSQGPGVPGVLAAVMAALQSRQAHSSGAWAEAGDAG